MSLGKRLNKLTTSDLAKKSLFYVNVIIRVLQSMVLFIISMVVLFGALGTGIGVGYFANLVEDTKIPSKTEFEQRLGNLTQTSNLTYADNSLIASVSSDLQRTPVNGDQISGLLKQAIVATEDENFYIHKGFVPKAVLRAFISEITGIGSSGGSTLTQQLIKQQLLTNETTFKRKANEIILAHQVDKQFSKDDIITLYLNVSPFGRNNKGQNIAGVEEAARGIFGKAAKDLTLPQAAFIAGLPQSPITYSPYASDGSIKKDQQWGLKRKDFVLFSMYRTKTITKQQYEEAKAYDLQKEFLPRAIANRNEQSYIYYSVLNEAKNILAENLAKEAKISIKEFANPDVKNAYLTIADQKLSNGGYTIKSTIDKGIYEAMQNAATTYGSILDDGNGTVQMGNVLMDNNTGRIISFIGGRNYTANQFNHAFQSRRQAGSAIKPALVYGAAIDLGLVGTESRVSNYPTTWAGSNTPVNNANNYNMNTFQTIREAISWSNNIPAYQLYRANQSKLGSDMSVYDTYLSKMGYPKLDAWAYPSAPLGVAEVSVLEQTAGFQTLANSGVYEKAYMIDQISDPTGKAIYHHEAEPVQVYSKATASIMNDMMRTVIDKRLTTPYKDLVTRLNGQLGSADWVGKTGTTDSYKDSWLVVSTPSITLSSWTGHDDGTPSDSGAETRHARYLSNIANAIYTVSPETINVSKKFTLDPSVKKEKVNTFTGQKGGKQVDIKGKKINLPSGETESLWSKVGPLDSEFKFGIGGTDANYLDAWKKVKPEVDK